MTEAKPAAFAKGDQVTFAGEKLVVVNQGSPGGAVLCETPKGVKPYGSSFYAADSLKKGRGSKAKTTEPPSESYVVTLKRANEETYTLEVEAATEDAAVLLAVEKADDVDSDELVSVEKVDA